MVYDDKRSNLSTISASYEEYLAEARDTSELLALRQLGSTETIIEVQDDLESVSAPQVRKWCLCLLQSSCRLEATTRSEVVLLTRKRKKVLQKLVTSESETELRRRTKDTGRSTLEEGTEAFFLPNGLGAVAQRCVLGFSLTGFYLQTSLDNVARSGQVSCRHTGNGTCGEQLQDTWV
jgi:hypothetical protein